jgi:hypothetical protein
MPRIMQERIITAFLSLVFDRFPDRYNIPSILTASILLLHYLEEKPMRYKTLLNSRVHDNKFRLFELEKPSQSSFKRALTLLIEGNLVQKEEGYGYALTDNDGQILIQKVNDCLTRGFDIVPIKKDPV